MNMKYSADTCVHCHLCQKNCAFLNKYKIDIGDTDQLQKLAMHCFLCGKCSLVCPKGIDGREIVLNMRKKKVSERSGKLEEKGYGLLLWEKKDYRFRNYKHVKGGSVLFTGCNFPAFYPETMKYLSELLQQKAQMGTVIDCCGKPVAELGLQKEEERILSDMNRRLEQMGVQEIVMLCPNCYHFLKDRLCVNVTDIYRKLAELGLGKQIEEAITIFPPCPDRKDETLLKNMRTFLKKEPILEQDVQCCGLGGCAATKEPKIAAKMPGEMDKEQKLYTYCASCSGALTKKGYDANHLLLKILGKEEKPDIRRSFFNRVKLRYWRKKKR